MDPVAVHVEQLGAGGVLRSEGEDAVFEGFGLRRVENVWREEFCGDVSIGLANVNRGEGSLKFEFGGDAGDD